MKKFFWLKLGDEFFAQKHIKSLWKKGKLESILLYVRILTSCIDNDGCIEYQGIEDDIFEEIALEIDTDSQKVKECLERLIKIGIIEAENKKAPKKLFFPEVIKMTGSESESAKRM